jgi:ATP-dependent Clp protease adaptor protein ClpS
MVAMTPVVNEQESSPRASQDGPAPVPAPAAPAPAVAAPPAPAKAPPQRKPLDQYKVLLHNDDESEMLYVVRSIVEIAHLAPKQALAVMLEAHTEGVSLVAVTHQELAELYRDQFRSKGLTATIEPA